MTAGLDVFVQDVIAAMTTEPCSSSKVSPSSVTCAPPGISATAVGATWTTAPPSNVSVPGSIVRRRVARRERLRDRLVVGGAVVDAERRELVEERVLRLAQRHAVLRPPRPGERRLDGGEIELDHLRVRRRLVRVVPEAVLLAVRLDEGDALVGRPVRRR